LPLVPLVLGLVAGCARGPLPPAARPSPAEPAAMPADGAILSDGAAYAAALRDGREHADRHDDRGAIAGYRRALAANPGDQQVLYFLALASLHAGDRAAALDCLGRLAELGSDLVPTADDFAALAADPAFVAVAARIGARAAGHRRAVEAFRLPEPGLLAEGIAWDPVGRAFYVGSATRRKIVKIPEGRAPADFATAAGAGLDAIGGLRVDGARRRLWAVTGTDRRMDGFVAGAPERNELVAFDLDSGAVVARHRLDAPGSHGLNDVAVDAGGRPVATDSDAGQLYTVVADRATLVPLFASPPYFRPNGLAFADDGRTLFVADGTGLHRVDLARRTSRRLGQPRSSSLGIFDGLYFVRDAGGPRLVGIQSLAGPGRVLSLRLDAGLDAVTRVDVLESAHPLFDAPTTGAVVGSALYVIANSQLWFPRPPAATIVVALPLDLPMDGGALPRR
jgi:sugar lactone lactonase YvrE